MKAIVQERYGSLDALRLAEIDKPSVADDEVLVRVRAASVHPDVWHVVTGRPYVLRLMGAGLRRPKDLVPGTDVAGQVESVGPAVTRFRPGDEVFGETTRLVQWRNGGAYAEYVAVAADNLAVKPANVTFEQAACVPTAGLIALQGIRSGGLRSGQSVLVNGAGGGVGGLTVQLAKAYGARVTAVDHTEKLDLLRSLGADRVIDYTQQDFTRADERYDLIIDVPGNHPFSAVRRALTPTGRYVLIGHDAFGAHGRRVLGSLPRFFGLMARALFVRQLPAPSFSTPRKGESMAVLSEFLAAGRLTPVIDRTYPLSEVPAAIRFLTTGRARGRIVIVM